MRRLPIRGQPFAKRPMRLPMSSSMSLRTRLWASTPLLVHERPTREIHRRSGVSSGVMYNVHVRPSLAPRSDVLSASVLNCTAPTPHLWGGQSTVGTAPGGIAASSTLEHLGSPAAQVYGYVQQNPILIACISVPCDAVGMLGSEGAQTSTCISRSSRQSRIRTTRVCLRWTQRCR